MDNIGESCRDWDPYTINVNIDAKTNGNDVDNILTQSLYFIFNHNKIIDEFRKKKCKKEVHHLSVLFSSSSVYDH